MEATYSITKTLESRTLKWYGHVKRLQNRDSQETSTRNRRNGEPALHRECYVMRVMDERVLVMGNWNDRELWKLKRVSS
ncbi:hypothetical protein C0J52_17700 [Blattella germanica]|nr:hypothetical protein C0J52_17700 [Blattella germanica]